MIKNFAELKIQLEELSSVINNFKSEAVQLRIVELIFRAESTEDEPGDDESNSGAARSVSGRKRRRTRASAKATPNSKETSTRTKTARGGRKGGAAILLELIDEGFFAKKRTISDVIANVRSQQGRTLKPNELSSPLVRFIRPPARLKREKNADGQYRYYKP